MEPGAFDGRCAEESLLQQWVDGELPPVAAELLFVHLEHCTTCAAKIRELHALKASCEEPLGAEDEDPQAASAEAIARVRRALARGMSTDRSPARLWRSPARWWRPLAAALVLAVGLTAAVVGLLESRTSASGERILAETVLRERAWQDEPNSIRRWLLEIDVRGNPAMPDGHYRMTMWKRNGNEGFASIYKRFDANGRFVAGTWRHVDGTQVIYDSSQAPSFQVIPSTAQLRAEGASLTSDAREALEAFLQRREPQASPVEQRRLFEEWFTRNTDPATPGSSAQKITSTQAGDVYYIRTDQRFETRGSAINRIVAENYISADDLRRLRAKVTRYHGDGRVEMDDTRWTSYGNASASEFEANTFRAAMAQGGLKRWSAADVAGHELDSRAQRLVPLKPGT